MDSMDYCGQCGKVGGGDALGCTAECDSPKGKRLANQKKVRIVHVPVGQQAKVETVEGTLETYQGLVGGLIEEIGWSMDDESAETGISIILNEEGLLTNLPLNLRAQPDWGPFFGDLFFVRFDANGDYVSLTDDDLTYIAHMLPSVARYNYDGPNELAPNWSVVTT